MDNEELQTYKTKCEENDSTIEQLQNELYSNKAKIGEIINIVLENGSQKLADSIETIISKQ